jgi:DNA polymerase
MRAALHALTDELKRLKASGVKTVSVTDETLGALRKVLGARATQTQASTLAISAAAATKAPASTISPTTTAPSRESSPATRENLPSLRVAPSTKPASAEASATTSKLPPPPVVALPTSGKQERWDALLKLVTNDPVCLSRVRPGKKVVLGVGNLDAHIFFCGEAPGAEEEVKGEPFVGPAGQLLTKMIQAMGLKRSDVYIGNIMNWRPDLPTPAGQEQIGNRPPASEEMAYCLPFLRAQLEIVNPEFIVALGSTAAQGLFGAGSFKTLGEIRGRWKPFADKPVMVTYHPSYILRNPSNRSKRAIWEDLLQVMERAALPISDKQRSFFLDK